MYGKIFEQMYDGSLACGNWEALVTMQQLIVLADEEGVVDMNAFAIHRRTTIPIEIITKGLALLLQEDPNSRTKNMDGRRIVPIDPDRDWGWRLVNYKYYRDLANKADKREKDRLRISEKRNEINNVADSRKASQSVAESSEPSQTVANVAHTDTDTDTDIKTKLQLLGIPDRLWLDFQKHRKQLRASLTERATNLALNTLTKLKAEGQNPAEIIEQSILNGWKGLFPVREKQSAKAGGQNAASIYDR